MRKKTDLQNINDCRNSFAWEQFQCSTKNISREKENIHRAETFSETNRIAMEFSFCAGTLTENLTNLRAKLALTSTKTKRADLTGIIKTAEFIQSNGPIVATTDAAKIFCEEKAKYLP